MHRAKAIAKWGLIACGGLLASVALAVALGFGWLNSDGGRDWLARQIEDAASTPGEIELSIGSLTGSLPQNLRARDIVLRDGAGPWLSVAALEIDWRPWQLLSRRLDVERLALTGVDLARLPATPPDTADAGGSSDPRELLDFPLRVRLGRLAVDEIALGEPVLGQAARFTLSGEAGRRDDGSLAARLDLVRLDGPEGRLLANLHYKPQDDSLTAEVDATSARGGLLATLLDIPDLPGIELNLTGSGPLADWAGDLTLALGDLADAEAAIGLERRNNGDLAFRLQGASTVRPPEGDDLWRLAAGRTEIDLQGVWRDGRHLHLDRFAAANDSLRLDLRGDLVPESDALDLKLMVQAADASALAALAGLDGLRSLAGDIAVSGTLNRPQATLDLRAEGLATPDVAAEAVAVSGRITAERDLLGPAPLLALDLRGQLDAPRLPGQEEVNQFLGDRLPLSLAGELDLETLVLDIAALEVAAGPATLTASGPFNLGDGSAQLEAVAQVADLAALQPLTEITLGGPLRLAGPVALEGFGSRIVADLTGRWEQPSSDIGLIDALAGDGLDVTARLVIAGSDVRIEQATARSTDTTLEATLTVAGASLRDGRYSLSLADAQVLSRELGVALAGPATVEGELSGPFDALDLSGRARLAELTVENQTLSDISGTYRLRLSGADVDGPITVALTSPFGPAEASSDLQVRSEAVTLANLRASLPQTTVTGRVTLPLDGGGPIADLEGAFADIGPWLELAGFSGGGSGNATLQLNRSSATAPLTASADLSGLTLLTEPGAMPISAAHLAVALQAQDPAFTESLEVAVTATSLRRDQLELERVALDAVGSLSALDVTLQTSGRWVEPLELAARARVTQQDETLAVAVTRAEGRAFGQPLALERTATLTVTPDATRLEGLALASGDTRLSADAALGDGRIMLQAALAALPLSTVDAFWDSGLAGEISAEVNLTGSFAAPQGTARFSATGLRPRDSQDTPALELTATGDWRNGRVKAEGQLGGAQVAAARFSADAPLQMTPDGAIDMPPQAPLSGQLEWTGDIRTLLLFVPLPAHRLDGGAQIALTVGGTLGAPQVEGRIALDRGRYENLETGTILRDLALTAEATDERVTLTSLSANDGAGGTVRGSGSLAIDPERNFPFDISIDLDRFHAVRRDDVTAVTGGKVTLGGDIGAPHVEGRFTTETVEISLLTDLPPNVVSLDVIEMKDGVVVERPEEADREPPIDATLDIVVEMPRRIFVRGRGLDSEWAGRISVQGPAAEPTVTGEVNLVRGQLSVVGKPFILQAGKVTLPQGADTEPAINVTAVHEGQNLTVTARLSGPLSRPELDLTSVPEVPRDEIVSRVLFNKSAAGLSAAEAAQLAIALRDLTGRGGGSDILGFARRTLGVDVLRIETVDGEAPALEAGRYLTDEVYIGVKQGAGAQSTSAGVEVELTPNITIESEVTGKGASKSGVRFQWDY
ncbi:MAG: translocation/assembly module TamB domain-containing protein [Kiloniellaceae bacterium]